MSVVPLSNKTSPRENTFVNVSVPTLSIPPIYVEPPIPTPPATINAPVVDEVELSEEVTASPETDNISVLGLKKSVRSLETAIPPEPETVLVGLVNKRV